MFMKATDLNRALNYVDDAYLMEADTPYKVIETESKEIKPMKTQKRAFRILLAAALIGVLSITAYAAEMLPIHKLESGKTKHYESYSDVDRAIAQVGLEVSVPEEFENGFRFQGVDVGQTIGKDARDEKVLTYRQLSVSYENPQGQELTLLIRADMKEVSETESIPSISRTVDTIAARYYLDHYKFVPEGYKLSEAEQAWAKQPNNHVSYGADTVQERDVAFLCWTEDGICYSLLDQNILNPDTLFAMAGDLIQQ